MLDGKKYKSVLLSSSHGSRESSRRRRAMTPWCMTRRTTRQWAGMFPFK